MQITNITLYTNRYTNGGASFKGSSAAAIPAAFKVETKPAADKNEKAPGFFQKYGELKKYNMSTSNMITIAGMEQSEYEFVLGKLRESFDRNQALINKDTKLNFSKTTEDFCGVKNANIQDTAYNFNYSDGYGDYFYKETSTKRGKNKLFITREYDRFKGGMRTSFSDKSLFNGDYRIENTCTEASLWEDGYMGGTLRNISIKGYASPAILGYSYKRSASKDLLEYTVNDKRYKVKVSEDGIVTITSGKKGRKIDFSKRLDEKVSKKTFVEALRMLPPQILFAMDENYDSIKAGSKGKDKRTLYVNSSDATVASQIMINDTMEMLFYKHRLNEDEELIRLYEKERKQFTDWLENPKETCLKKGEEAYLNGISDDTEEGLLETVKKTCRLLWTEEYEEGKANDEEMRLLLNFFPKTVAHLVTTFELNTAQAA